MPMSRILVATDGSPGAARAVAVAADLTHALDGDLLIVTIAGSIPPKVEELVRAEGGLAQALELFSERILVEAKEQAASIGFSNARIQSGSGDIAEGIIDIARRERSDIIVVGRRGRGQLSGLLLGSVSQKLVSLALSSVLVVP